jgi:hypothetical protein
MTHLRLHLAKCEAYKKKYQNLAGLALFSGARIHTNAKEIKNDFCPIFSRVKICTVAMKVFGKFCCFKKKCKFEFFVLLEFGKICQTFETTKY